MNLVINLVINQRLGCGGINFNTLHWKEACELGDNKTPLCSEVEGKNNGVSNGLCKS